MTSPESQPLVDLKLEINAAVQTAIQVGTMILPTHSERLRPAQLRRRPACFVGRTTEIDAVCGYLAAPEDVSALVIHGRPGEGKTSLALEAAHRTAGLFPDGQLMCEFRTHSGAEPAAVSDVLARFLRDLGVAAARVPASLDERVAMYRSLTGGSRRLLVVLDDVRTEDDVRLLVPASPSSAVLVTSRATLSGLATEGARLLRLDVMTADDAATLLIRLAGRGEGSELGLIRRVVELCGQLPLAICIAGARLAVAPQMRIASFADSLAEQGAALSGLTAGDRSVRAAFSASYLLLPEQQQHAMAALGRIPLVSFSDESVAVLLGHPAPAASDWQAMRTQDARAVGDILSQLADLHLLDRIVSHRRSHYTLHDLIRQFCSTLRGEVDENALMEWYRDWTDYAWNSVQAPEPSHTALSWYHDEWDNIVVVADNAAANGRHNLLWSLADSIYTDREVHTSWPTWRRITERAADAAQATGDRCERGLRTRLALAYREWQLFDQAIAAAQRVLTIGLTTKDMPTMADGRHALGEIHRDRGAQQEAAENYQAAIEARRALGDKRGLAWSLHGLGDVRTHQAATTAALSHHTEALALFTDLADAIGQAWSWQGIGDAHRAVGRHDDAANAYTTAIDLHRTGGGAMRGSWSDYSLGLVRLDEGRLSDANELFTRSYSAFVQLGQVHLQAHALTGLGDALSRTGEERAARQIWERARAILLAPTSTLHAELTERLLRSIDPPQKNQPTSQL
ncbi:tetratricopeptide repeat protein [Streptomyces sp. Tu102]|uniref:tetratricopeptide repeat protein n=1 Tax=Streptomyces TaxID=1883 RepID=UPI001BDCA0B4|nr:tetratricopeptide repeat protein [Streptomyces sp. Tu102]MBT1098366.1 tetratricopeptide repeat protein [Streptomyces sp. Tu102]